MCDTTPLPLWVQEKIISIAKSGNTAEVKIVRGAYVVIEIRRKAYKEEKLNTTA